MVEHPSWINTSQNTLIETTSILASLCNHMMMMMMLMMKYYCHDLTYFSDHTLLFFDMTCPISQTTHSMFCHDLTYFSDRHTTCFDWLQTLLVWTASVHIDFCPPPLSGDVSPSPHTQCHLYTSGVKTYSGDVIIHNKHQRQQHPPPSKHEKLNQ